MVAREYLKHTGNLELSNEQFGEYILTLLDLYSPVEVEKEAEKIKKNGVEVHLYKLKEQSRMIIDFTKLLIFMEESKCQILRRNV